MRDANAEISQLRQRLRFKNLSEEQIDSICSSAAIEISRIASDLLADAMSDAVNAGGDAMSIEFIDELRAIRSGSHFQIITDSGKTDFSEPPFPMLPRLLKNAKVSKDGSLYKVIPIRGKASRQGDVSAKKTTEAAIRAVQHSREEAKKDRETTHRIYTSPDTNAGMSTFAAMMSVSKSRTQSPKNQTKSTEPVMDFRTASSKQDPNSKWVIPGKSNNLGPSLRQINAELQDSIDKTIEEVIRRYEGGF